MFVPPYGGVNFPYKTNLNWIVCQILELKEKTGSLEQAWEEFQKNFDSELDQTVKDQLTEWLNDGTLATMLQDWFPYVNVMQYGAKGDGISDDSDAINNAIAAWQEKQSIYAGIYFPIGSFLISKTINVPPGCNIVGSSNYQSEILVNYPELTAFTLISDSLVGANLEICNLHIRGMYPDTRGFYVDNYARYYIHDILFSGLKTCGTFCRGGLNTIERLNSQGWGSRPAGNFEFGAFYSNQDYEYSFINSVISNIKVESQNGVNSPAIHFRWCAATKIHNFFSTNSNYESTGILIDGDSQGLSFTDTMLAILNEGIRIEYYNNNYPKNITFTSCDIDQCKFPMLILGGAGLLFNGGQITSSNKFTDSPAINITSPLSAIFNNLYIGGYNSNNGRGIWVQASETNGMVKIVNSRIDSCVYGVLIENGGHANLFNNSFNNCTNVIIGLDSSPDIINVAKNNIGFKPWTIHSTPTAPGTTEHVNIYGVPVDVVLNTDMYKTLTINGQATAIINGITFMHLEPGDTYQFGEPLGGSNFQWWWLFKQ